MQAVTITQITPFELESLIENSLRKIINSNKPNTPTEPTDRWFNVNELCNYLPDRPAKQTIYGKVSNNEIPHYKDAKKLRFLKSEIDIWLKQGRKKTTIEVQEEIQKATDTFLSKRKGGNHGK